MIRKGDLVFPLCFAIYVSSVKTVEGRIWADFDSGKLYTEHHFITKGSSRKIPSPEFRIEDKLIPISYKLDLRPILDVTGPKDTAWTVDGTVEIRLKCQEKSDQITLHAYELSNIEITNTKVWEETTGDVINVKEILFEQANGQAATFTLASTLTPGNTYVLKISHYLATIADYKGLQGRMNGMYQSTYTNEDNKLETIATTHFSRTRGFRKLVPSFDDPKFKASFEVRIGRHLSYSTLFNTEKLYETPTPIDGYPDWVWDHYTTTPVMPPTIIAMVIYKDLGHVTAVPTTGFEKPVRVWGPPGLIEAGQATFSVCAVAKLLEHYNGYFGIPYEMTKMDSVGVHHFGSSAMENWGLNIYRSPVMFLHPATATTAQYLSTVSIISHELSHQWWGNLVTHQWWNDWWLTEGFASYYQYDIFNQVYPEFAPGVRAISDGLQSALAFDITQDSRPIHGEFKDYFDNNPGVIDYSKGAALVRMMSGFLTEPVFTKGVKYYLNKRRYTAASQAELFVDLQESLEAGEFPENGVEIKDIMKGWTTTMGFPLVRVSISDSPNNTVSFTQERFKECRDGGRPDIDQSWYIPVMFASRSQPNFGDRKPDFWLNSDTTLVSRPVSNSRDWLVVNPEARGYYRVLYDDHYAGLLQAQLTADLESIPEVSRSQLIDDYLTAAFELYVSFDEADRMAAFVKNDGRLGPWLTFLNRFYRGYHLVRQELPDHMARLKLYMLPKVQGGLTKIGVTPDPADEHQTNILRSHLFAWGCGLEDPDTVAYADAAFDAWVADPVGNPIQVDLRATVFCQAAFVDPDGTKWDAIMTEYVATKDLTVRIAFQCSMNQNKLNELLDFALQQQVKEEGWGLLSVVARSTVKSRGQVIKVLTEDMKKLVDFFEIEGILDVFNAMAPLVSDAGEIARIEIILSDHDQLFTPDVRDKLRSSVDTMVANGVWLEKFIERYVTYFPKVPGG